MIHHNPFFSKRKDIFSEFLKKFQGNKEWGAKNANQFRQKSENPKEDTQYVWAGKEKAEGSPKEDSGEKEDSELSVSDVEGKQQQRGQKDQAEEQIAEMGQSGAVDSQCPKKGPEHCERHTEIDREQKLVQLVRDRQIHPSSRAQKPPSFLASS